MAVAITSAAPHLVYRAQTYYFCGTGCRNAFADAPERHLAA
jgi:xanthine dehydrogenase accessory factor